MIRLGYWAVGLLLHGVVVAASAENAVNPADARRVVAHRLQLPAPKNAFEAWVADMTLWAALGCARGASLDEELRLLEKVRLLDILPALLSQRERPWAIGPFSNGDSYGVLQSIHLEESLRWVPASSEMHALPLRAWHG